MNEELNKALTDLIVKATETAESGAAFLQSEIPEVVEQLLLWHLVQSSVFCALGLFVTVLCMFLIRKYAPKCDAYDMRPADAIVILSALFWVMSLMVAVPNGFTAFKILIAPKVWLIEYTARLVQ